MNTEYKRSIVEIQKLYSQNVKRLHLLQAKKCKFPESGKKRTGIILTEEHMKKTSTRQFCSGMQIQVVKDNLCVWKDLCDKAAQQHQTWAVCGQHHVWGWAWMPWKHLRNNELKSIIKTYTCEGQGSSTWPSVFHLKFPGLINSKSIKD